LCYVAETWTLSNADSNKLKIFEIKVVRKIIYCAVFKEGSWRIRNNKKIEQYNIVRFIKAGRTRWLGHVQRMDKEDLQQQQNWKNAIKNRGLGQL